MCRLPDLPKIKSVAIHGLIFIGMVNLWLACSKEPVQKKPALTAPVANEVLIKFKPGVPEDSVRALATRLGLEHVRDLRDIGVRVFRTTSRFTTEQVLRACQSDACVEYAEPNSTVKIPEKN